METDIFSLRPAYDELWNLGSLTAHSLWNFPHKTWHEGFFEAAKMARKGSMKIIMYNQPENEESPLR